MAQKQPYGTAPKIDRPQSLMGKVAERGGFGFAPKNLPTFVGVFQALHIDVK